MTNISVSEINSFLRCRRAWDLTSHSRQSLRHKVTPKIFFVIGSAVHEAIDAQARGDDPYGFFEEYVSRERADRRLAYEESTGSSAWDSEMEEFEDSVNLARSLVRQYFNHYTEENPLEERGLKYVGTEIPFSIPLPNGTNFVGIFDGIATDIATESQYYLIENKTAAQKPRVETIQSSNQFVGYNWVFRTLTGHTPAGTLYNGIIKKLIKSPRVLKSGELSQDKQAGVTLQTFLEALKKGGHDPVKYLPYLEYLQERESNGDDRFFYREMFTYSNVQLDNWYKDVLKPLSREMTSPDFGEEDIAVYPNFTSCDGCLVKDLCNAMQLGESIDAVVSARYQVGTYSTMKAVAGATPDVVASVSDLLESLNGIR